MSPLADLPFEEFMVELLEFPFLDASPGAPAADLVITPFLVVALLLAMTSSASLPSTRRFLLGGVAVVKDSALLDIYK